MSGQRCELSTGIASCSSECEKHTTLVVHGHWIFWNFATHPALATGVAGHTGSFAFTAAGGMIPRSRISGDAAAKAEAASARMAKDFMLTVWRDLLWKEY